MQGSKVAGITVIAAGLVVSLPTARSHAGEWLTAGVFQTEKGELLVEHVYRPGEALSHLPDAPIDPRPARSRFTGADARRRQPVYFRLAGQSFDPQAYWTDELWMRDVREQPLRFVGRLLPGTVEVCTRDKGRFGPGMPGDPKRFLVFRQPVFMFRSDFAALRHSTQEAHTDAADVQEPDRPEIDSPTGPFERIRQIDRGMTRRRADALLRPLAKRTGASRPGTFGRQYWYDLADVLVVVTTDASERVERVSVHKAPLLWPEWIHSPDENHETHAAAPRPAAGD